MKPLTGTLTDLSSAPFLHLNESSLRQYEYPELFAYRKEWIPHLKHAKRMISSGITPYVCHAITALMTPGQPNKELRALHREIQLSLGGASTVSVWSYWNNEEEEGLPRSMREYRLGWLDHIIEECKDA